MTVILNAASGAKRAAGQSADIKEAFRAAGVEPDIRFVREGASVREAAAEAVRAGERTVVAAGGDGTVSSVAAALARTEANLGVLPIGTLNHFAKDMDIPLDLGEAARTAVKGRVKRIDAGEVNGRIFINNASLGLYTRMVVRRQEEQQKGWSKWAATAWAAAGVFSRFPLLTARIHADGESLVRTTPFVFIGNNEYRVEGFLGSRARLDGGTLWVYVAPDRPSRWGLVRLALRVLAGRARQSEELLAFPAARVTIETITRRQAVAVDGEVVSLETPLDIRVLPAALRVLAPA